ncbi:MAG: type II toxin-antitoxin system HicA family toxin [Deltaproteobacteria bacterium]|nr:type II toxin-antitoxin system HicA family toxin [Deltaproteobacteria bacterium]
MNSRNRKTLTAIFAQPQQGTIDWDDIERLLLAVGAHLIEGRGSRVRFEAGGKMAAFHRPHPRKEAHGYQITVARKFLMAIGVTPYETDDL